MAIKHYNALNK